MRKQIQATIRLFFISLFIPMFTTTLADEKNNTITDNNDKPHRSIVPYNNDEKFIIVFNDGYSNVEIIMEENGFVVEYMTKETVLQGECFTITCPDNISEYTLTIKANASIIYREVIKNK